MNGTQKLRVNNILRDAIATYTVYRLPVPIPHPFYFYSIRVIVLYIFISDFIQKLFDPKSIGPSRCLRCCCCRRCCYFYPFSVSWETFLSRAPLPNRRVSWLLAPFSSSACTHRANANGAHIFNEKFVYLFTMRSRLPVCNLMPIERRLNIEDNRIDRISRRRWKKAKQNHW